ncbi:MAG: hypothetical protein EBS38_08995, partial [Actinobacteria bacterium]|nr:hypothetical protein [Actinomycetota bacterium]
MLGDLKLSPKWDPVTQAQPVTITAPKPTKKPKTKHKVAVSLPDPQIGGRFLFDYGWDPFHDEAAMDVALQIVSYLEEIDRVDYVINLGDFLDLPSQGRFDQEAGFAGTTQKAIDRGHL